MRTKLLVSLLMAAASSSVFAMPANPVKHSGILEIALTGGGYVVGTEDTDYGLQLISLSNFSKPTGSVLKIDPSYKFGGGVLLGYYFPCSSINVDASYFGSHHTLNDTATGPISASQVPPEFIDPQGVTFAESSYRAHYDFVNLEVGSLTRINQNGLILNPQVGLSYAHVSGDQNITYGGDTNGRTAFASQDVVFHGFGPSAGLDLNFVVCQPITLMGNFRYSALVGKSESTYSALVLDADGDLRDNAAITTDSRRSLVSLFQAELAVGYDFNWIDAFCGNIALGYQLTNLFGVGENTLLVDDVADNNFVNISQDFAIHGWFLRLTMDFPV